MPTNIVCIVLRPYTFETRPACPEVMAGFEPFKIAVDWSHDPGTWASVAVDNFVDQNGNPVSTVGPKPIFTRAEGNVVKDVNFASFVTADAYCKYDLVYTKTGGSEVYTVDPTLRLRRLG